MNKFDIIIIGAGASGLTVAARGIASHKSVCVLDMGTAPARKLEISGGGKCNFTNAHADYKHYFGQNPDFTRGALARWTYDNTLNWVKSHNIPIHEKTPGQYFADSAKNIVNALLSDADGAKIILDTRVDSVEKSDNQFIVHSGKKSFYSEKLVIATGGMSYANMGTSDIGYKIAKQFGHKIIPTRPALCAISTKAFDSSLSGISLPVEIKIGKEIINDTMLFTHFGIGGPAIYRATVRDIDNGFTINLLPKINAFNWLQEQKHINGKKHIKTILSTKLPERIAAHFSEHYSKNIADLRDNELQQLADKLCKIYLDTKSFTLQNFQSAEVTRGGVDTSQISSKTMESKLCKNLYFIGEVIDIAGDLGGFNLQWAWSSANILEI